MVASNGILPDSRESQHRDNLRRDGLMPPAGEDRGAALRIALALAGVFALAVIGSLPAGSDHGSDPGRHLAQIATPPQLVAVPEPPRSEPAR